MPFDVIMPPANTWKYVQEIKFLRSTVIVEGLKFLQFDLENVGQQHA